MSRLCSMLVLALLLIAGSARADEKSIKTRLADKGIRATHYGLMLKEENELNRAFGEANSLKKKLTTAVNAYNALERQEEQSKDAFNDVLQQNVEANRQLKSTGQGGFVNPNLYNNLVSEANATNGELKLLDDQRKEFDKQLDEARKTVNAARDKYVQKLSEVRELADRVPARYTELAKDSDVQAAVSEWNSEIGKSFKLEPPPSFRSSMKRLEALEKAIVTDHIQLRRVGGSLIADVVINGIHQHEMIVDTGATLVMLPYELAIKFGLNLDKARVAKAHIADGSAVDMKIIKLESLRLGKFTATNIECGISPPQASKAPSLLGMSFLGRFQFQLNGTELLLSKIEMEASAAGKHKKPPAKKHKPKSDLSPPSE